MRNTTLLCWFVLLGFTMTACQNTRPGIPEKPNILFLFADDFAYDAIGVLGNTEVRTPNLDALAAEGMRFTHAYNMGGWSGAICVASRAMLNTGRFVWDAHSYQNRQEALVRQGQMWGQLMAAEGYDTYMTGKWHVKTPAEELFHTVEFVCPGMPPDRWGGQGYPRRIRDSVYTGLTTIEAIRPLGYYRPQHEYDTAWQPWDTLQGGFWKGGKHWSEVQADHAISFIEQSRQSENPFFMYIAFNASHDPRQSPKPILDLYPVDQVEVPENFIPEYPYKDDIGNGMTARDEALGPFPRTEYAVRKHRQEYYALITHMDRQIGRILEKLESAGFLDNTIIFFSADHGLAVGQHGLLGKQNMYDHSLRVPFFISGPGIPKDMALDQDIYLQDVMPTSLELSGQPVPDYVSFKSLMPLIRGEQTDSSYPAVYGCYLSNAQRMIRKEGYKLIAYPRIGVLRLYDLETDPEETRDLAEDPGQKPRVQALFKDLVKLAASMEDTLDLQGIYADHPLLASGP